jgi:hypothetical protein
MPLITSLNKNYKELNFRWNGANIIIDRYKNYFIESEKYIPQDF